VSGRASGGRYDRFVFEKRERHRTRAVADIVPALARQLLTAPEPPSRLPTVRELARQHRSSLSSIHMAMGRLEESGAIDIEVRGRLGAFMVGRSVGRLWAMAEAGRPLVIALPLASSPRYEALATAIKQILTRVGLEVFLIFVRGSRQRLQAVREGRCHLAVMSSFAASELCGPDDAVVVELPPLTYNTGHRVFFSPSGAERHPLRVIVDRHSADQQLITALEFSGADVELLPAMTAQFARLLAEGQGDAAVWTVDEMRVRWPHGVLDRSLSPHVRDHVGDRDTRAVLVGRGADAGVLGAITASIEGGDVEHIQLDVMAGRVVPEY
jgi:YhfZ C-terminal domain